MSIWKCVVLITVFVLSGCARVQQLQELSVTLDRIESVSISGLSPRFNVHLLVLNPNAQDLDIEGVSIQLDIASKKILAGVSNQIPKLQAYSETPVVVQTSISLYQLYKVLAYVSQHSNEDIKYLLNAKIDPKGFIAFNINKEGILNDELLQGLISK